MFSYQNFMYPQLEVPVENKLKTISLEIFDYLNLQNVKSCYYTFYLSGDVGKYDSIEGEVPKLWEKFNIQSPSSTERCFYVNKDTTKITNWMEIPEEYGGLRITQLIIHPNNVTIDGEETEKEIIELQSNITTDKLIKVEPEWVSSVKPKDGYEFYEVFSTKPDLSDVFNMNLFNSVETPKKLDLYPIIYKNDFYDTYQVPEPQECDYYFETLEEFSSRITQICEENKNFLHNKTFGFADSITTLAISKGSGGYESMFPTSVVSMPKCLVGKNVTNLVYLGGYVLRTRLIPPTLFKGLPLLKNINTLLETASIGSSKWDSVLPIIHIGSKLLYNNKLEMLSSVFEGWRITRSS